MPAQSQADRIARQTLHRLPIVVRHPNYFALAVALAQVAVADAVLWRRSARSQQCRRACRARGCLGKERSSLPDIAMQGTPTNEAAGAGN